MAGGTPDKYGWVEYTYNGYDYRWSGCNCDEWLITVDDGRQFWLSEIDPDEWNALNEEHTWTQETVFPAWHQAAREELGFTEH